MALYLGSGEPTALYLGATEVQKAYLGATEVWGSAATPPLLVGLLNYYSFDEASGNRADSHGSNTLTDNNTVGSNTGIISNAAEFVSASSEYLSATGYLPVTGAGDRSVFGWVRATTTSGRNPLIGWGANSTGQRCTLKLQGAGSDLRIEIQGGGYTSSLNVTLNTYAFVGFTFSGSTLAGFTIYCDGASEAATGSNTVNTSAGTDAGLRFGADSASPTGDFNGRLDEWGIWNRVLTAGEIAFLYNSGAGRAYSDLSSYTP